MKAVARVVNALNAALLIGGICSLLIVGRNIYSEAALLFAIAGFGTHAVMNSDTVSEVLIEFGKAIVDGIGGIGDALKCIYAGTTHRNA